MAATPLWTVCAMRACATCSTFRAKVLHPSWMVCAKPSRYSSSPTATKAGRASWRKPTPRPRAHPEPALIQEMMQRLGAAKTPIIVAGSGTEYAGARQELIAFSEKFQVPVVTTYRRLAAFPNDHAHYLGNLSSARNHTRDAVAGADLVLAIGTRLNQQTTAGFTLPHPDQTLIQIDPAEEVIGQNYRPTIGMVSDIKLALAAALEYPAPPPNAGRQGWIDEYRKVQQIGRASCRERVMRSG